MITTDQIKASVLEAIGEYWHRYSRPILSARLGEVVDKAAKAEVKARGQMLSEFITREMHETVETISVPGMGRAFARRDDTEGLTEDDLTSRVKGMRHPLVSRRLYNRTLYEVFAKPEGEKYIEIDLEGEVAVGDKPGSDQQNWMRVEPSDLPSAVTPGGRANPADARMALENWLSRNSIDVSRVSQIQNPGTRRSIELVGSNEFLKRLTELQTSDLARIAIPLDLVIRILGK